MVKFELFRNSVFESNTYLIEKENSIDCFLVDCGDVDDIIGYLRKRGLVLKGIFLTHTHFDHIYGLNSMIDEFPDLVVYTSGFGKIGLFSDKLNLSRYYLHPFVFQYPDRVEVLNEKSNVNLWEQDEIEIIETPGHDRSCLTYKVDNNLFSGDSFIPGIKVVTSLPNSNKTDAEVSLHRILSLSKDCNLCPGHGEIYESFQPEIYL